MIPTSNVLLAIPARGGSKRLPRKNLALINGKPMIAYTIEAALESGLSDSVYVCTEDDEIARVSREWGAKVFQIPQSMTEDDVSSTVPCLVLYDSLTEKSKQIDYIFNLQPTSPLRSSQDITESLATLKAEDAHYLVSVTPIDPHYFHWAMVEKSDGWQMYFGTEFLKERIYLPDAFRPNGAIKLAVAGRLKKTGNYFGAPLAVHEMPEHRSIHVATEFDLICTQAVLTAGNLG